MSTPRAAHVRLPKLAVRALTTTRAAPCRRGDRGCPVSEAWDYSRYQTSTERATVRVEVGRTTAWLYGAGLARMLDELEVPRMWDWHPDRKRVLMCAVDRVADLLALLEHRDRRVVEVVAVDR